MADRAVARLADAEAADRACPYAACDGSGWILGPEDVARPCECRERRVTRARSRGVASVIPARFRGVGFDRPPVTDMAPAVVEGVREYVDELDANLETGRGLWLTGDVGTGKTTLAMLISKAALESGHSVAIYSLPRLLARIRRTYDAQAGEQSYLEFFERLTSVDLLHVDDLGAEKRTDWVLEQLYAIVDERYESKRSILVTSNLDEPELRDQIGERTVSRLMEICGHQVIPLHGTDMRAQA
jgi:DNA replication protein DnaC